MGKYLLALFLIFYYHQSFALPLKVKKAINLSNNLSVYPIHDVNIAVHDISFFGYKLIISDLLDLVHEPAPLRLMSPHGISVAQIIVDPVYGVNSRQKINVLTKGIYVEDYEKAIALWRKHNIKLVNISMSFRSEAIIDLLNEFIDEGGIVIASAGNSALRLSPKPAPYYKKFKGLVVAAADTKGAIQGFSQYLKKKTILAPGAVKSIPVDYLKYKGNIIHEPRGPSKDLTIASHKFGQTSAAAPIISGIVSLALQENLDLNQKQINHALFSSAQIIDDKPFVNAQDFLRHIRQSL